MSIHERPLEALAMIALNVVVCGGLLALFLKLMADAWDGARRESDDEPPGPLAGA
jgi:hypothetical protein